MSSQYIHDDRDLKIRKSRRSRRRIIGGILLGIFGSMSLAVLYYIIFALVFSTDVERKLKQENRIYEKIYPEMEKKDKLLADVVIGLQMRDDEIYEDIFSTKAPNVERLMSVNFLASSDTLSDEDLASYTADKIEMLKDCSDRVESNFRRIYELCNDSSFVMPPMHTPIKGFNYSHAGATIGNKISPFYKVPTAHHGFDIIVPENTAVYASAKGVVSNVQRSKRAQGNVVEITHDGGYVTRYAHLNEIKVVKGRRVDEKTMIGTVGNSGFSFAPHLHYEVYKDGEARDPVNYLFGVLNPYEYADVTVMAVSTGQSMD